MRIFGPGRSAMIATRRPVACSAARMRAMRSAWPVKSPCEKLSRAMFSPARMRRSSISGDSEAGPIVATILVLWSGSIISLPIIRQSLGKSMKESTGPARTEVPWPFGVQWVEARGRVQFLALLEARHQRRAAVLHGGRPCQAGLRISFPASGAQDGERLALPHLRPPSCAAPRSTRYRVEGPHEPERGLRFDPQKVLLDPYAPSVFFPPAFSREACAQAGPTDGRAPLGRLPKRTVARSGRGRPAITPARDAVVYELHVKGFTARARTPASRLTRRGTFAGLTEKIPYLKELGVTIVELLPVHQFDPQEGNYWGYMTLHFFSPHQSYAHGEAFDEFRTMVRAFHAAGIEVWLDVVYNHTAEGDEHRADLQLPRRGQQQLLPADAGSAALRRRYRLRQHGAHRAIRARACWCSKASVSGRERWAWTVFASISRRSFHAPPTAR